MQAESGIWIWKEKGGCRGHEKCNAPIGPNKADIYLGRYGDQRAEYIDPH
jgi:hypothetical protein